MQKKAPITTINIPEYNFITPNRFSGETFKDNFGNTIPVEYRNVEPNFRLISSKIVGFLREHYTGKKIVLRFLSSNDHNEMTADELVEIIKKLGYDKYDPGRRGDRYENIENKHIDFFALEIQVGNEEDEENIEHALRSFYYFPVAVGGEPTKVNIGIIYDPAQVEVVEHQYKGRENEVKRDGFVFRYPNKRAEAILGIVKLL